MLIHIFKLFILIKEKKKVQYIYAGWSDGGCMLLFDTAEY